MPASVLRRLLIVCFTASGAAALIYQVAWVRLLTLALGHTVAAASTVLAAFMGGLALGSWAAGRASVARTRTLATYAVLELFIAATAIALPVLLAAFDPFLVWAYADATAPASFMIARIAVSLTLVGVPAAAMGATYPVAVGWLAHMESGNARDLRPAATAAGALYAANSAGAAAGALAAGFWLIEFLGIRGTTWIAVSLNVMAAGLALWLRHAGRLPSTAVHPVQRGRRAVNPERITGRPRPALAGIAAALSGFAALVYEVTWTRLLAMTLGPTTYAFATMAASFIAGIALGSSLGIRLARRSAGVALWLGAMLVATAVSTMLAAWFTASYLPLLIARDVATHNEFGSLFLRQVLTIVLVLLPASVSLGATFTLALATGSTGVDSAARQTARIYTANTLGAVAGALTAGFLLVPRFGLQATFLYASGLLLAAGTVIAALSAGHSTKRRLNARTALPFLAGGVLTVIAFGVSEWDRDLISSGAYKYPRQILVDDLESSLRAGHLEYYREGAAGTVSVRRLAGSRSLAIDGKVDASNGGDMLTQRLLGLLPTLLHPEPRDALVIGLGSGVTADAVLASGDVRHLDIVEISPEVVAASAYFSRENHDVLSRPAVRLLVGDGRSHLRLSARQYDVIVSEPSNPWMAGVAALFTREFFEAARARLRSRGIFCQWSHTYEIAERDLQSIVRTFASVFPHATMWLVGEGDLLLIGSVAPGIDERVSAVADRAQDGSVPRLLADLGVPPSAAPFVLLSMFAGGPRELALFGSGAEIQTDDRMSLEFTAARAMHTPPEGQAARLRALAASAALPAGAASIMHGARAEDWAVRGDAALRAQAFTVAHESFRHAVALDSRSARALRGSNEAAAGMRRMAEQTEWLKTLAAAEPGNAAVRVELSHALAALGDAEAAIAAAQDAARIDPSSAIPLEQLASVFADLGDTEQLISVADELISRFPSRHEGRYYRAAALFFAGRAAEAERAVQILLSSEPRHPKGLNLLGIICAARGDRECARRSFTQSLDVNPGDPSVYVNLGHLSLDAGDVAAAGEFFREALAVDPVNEAARRGIADARAAEERR
jgi:spermidine synthase